MNILRPILKTPGALSGPSIFTKVGLFWVFFGLAMNEWTINSVLGIGQLGPRSLMLIRILGFATIAWGLCTYRWASKRIVQNLNLTLLMTFLTVVLAEVALRWQYHRTREQLAAKYMHREPCTKPSENEELIYTNVPNRCGCNSQGYFDRERAYEKSPGTFRIVVIGDSLAAGQGLQRDEKFSQLLENRLNDWAPGKFEVLVLARSGYSQSQELIILENEAFKYEPDLILWSYVLNDPAHPVYHDANGELGKYYYRPRSHLVHFFSARLFALREKIKSRHCVADFHEILHCVYWEDVKANFTRLSQIGAEHNVRVILLIHPIFQRGRNFKEYTLVNLHRRLRDLAAQNGLPVLDLLHAFLNQDPEEIKQSSPNSYDPWHPNAAGHALIACAVEAFLRSGGHLGTTE